MKFHGACDNILGTVEPGRLHKPPETQSAGWNLTDLAAGGAEEFGGPFFSVCFGSGRLS